MGTRLLLAFFALFALGCRERVLDVERARDVRKLTANWREQEQTLVRLAPLDAAMESGGARGFEEWRAAIARLDDLERDADELLARVGDVDSIQPPTSPAPAVPSSLVDLRARRAEAHRARVERLKAGQ